MSAGVIAASFVATSSFDPRSIPGLVAWYSAEAETGYADGAAMTQWTDRSGNGNHAVAGATAPVWRAALGPAGGPTIEFEGGWFTLPSGIMSGATIGEVATIARARVDNQGWWSFGSSDVPHFPYGGVLYDSFGSTSRPAIEPVSLDTWYRYQNLSKAGGRGAWLNGVQVDSAVTNSVSFPAAPELGRSNGAWIFRGRMPVFALYKNYEQTTTERADLHAWMVSNPSGGTP